MNIIRHGKGKTFWLCSFCLSLFHLGLDSSLLLHDIYLLGFVLYHPSETWFLQPAVVIPTGSSTSITATITTTATTAVPSTGIATDAKEEGSGQERRPSWRLKVDNGDRSKVCPVVCACTCCLNLHPVASCSCHLIHHSILQD